MRCAPVFVAPDISVRDVLAAAPTSEKETRRSVTPTLLSGDVKAAEAGIVTEHNILRAIARFYAAALELPVRQIMSRPLGAVSSDAFVYRAIGRMNRLKTRHLGVVDEAGHVVGALSARDLLRLRAGRLFRLRRRGDR